MFVAWPNASREHYEPFVTAYQAVLPSLDVIGITPTWSSVLHPSLARSISSRFESLLASLPTSPLVFHWSSFTPFSLFPALVPHCRHPSATPAPTAAPYSSSLPSIRTSRARGPAPPVAAHIFDSFTPTPSAAAITALAELQSLSVSPLARPAAAAAAIAAAALVPPSPPWPAWRTDAALGAPAATIGSLSDGSALGTAWRSAAGSGVPALFIGTAAATDGVTRAAAEAAARAAGVAPATAGHATGGRTASGVDVGNGLGYVAHATARGVGLPRACRGGAVAPGGSGRAAPTAAPLSAAMGGALEVCVGDGPYLHAVVTEPVRYADALRGVLAGSILGADVAPARTPSTGYTSTPGRAATEEGKESVILGDKRLGRAMSGRRRADVGNDPF